MLVSSRATNILLVAILAVGIGIVAMLASGARGGPLDPPAAPSATGTLPQVEPRSPIPPVGWNGAFPIVISQPGSYFLTRSLIGVTDEDGIQVDADNVTLDLSGFTLVGNGTNSGIAVKGVHSAIRISNGIVRNWSYGIRGWDTDADIDEARFSRAEKISALNNYVGITLGAESEIVDCNASANTYIGIFAHYTVVRACDVVSNGQTGIYGRDHMLIEGNRVWNSNVGIQVGPGATNGESVIRSNTSINNTTADVFALGAGNIADDNTFRDPCQVAGLIDTNSQYLYASCP